MQSVLDVTETTNRARGRLGWQRVAAGGRVRAQLAVAALGLTLLGVPRAAWAAEDAESEATGYVVELSHGDLVVDLASARGARVGDELELWRPITVRHPVTRRVITDRFLIGKLRLTQVRDSLSLARPVGELAREPQAGDIVLLRAVVAPVPAPPSASAPGGSAPSQPHPPTAEPLPVESDVEAAEVARLFASLTGAEPALRIRRYEAYVAAHPRGRFAVVLYEEAAQLRALLARERTQATPRAPRLVNFTAPRSALGGQPLSFGVEVTGTASGAVLHARRWGDVAFTSTPMRAAGRGYFVLTVPGTELREPRLDYFIEATDAAGASFPLVGTSTAPKRLDVEAIPVATQPARHETTASLVTDFAYWNDPRRANDRVWQTEGAFGMRLGDSGIRAVRSGFGVYRGIGGSLEELDQQHKAPRAVGLTYGYLEGEVVLGTMTSLVLRGVLGLRDDGVSGGAQTLLRIGSDRTTNLLIGGEVLGGVGMRGITQLELLTFERVPIVLRTEVTNQPAGVSTDVASVRPAEENAEQGQTSTEQGEVGARAIVQVGYRMLPGLVVAARGSYQGRTINHAGPGFGGAVSYTW
ncbi:MAG: hypothetical protein OZ921_03030 [Sorangiineae bacterium]|nr:hypothetical protein [Polyangiaceae bacterium]MEB2321462.1 hypothetical protein [Sorangiineae bacterium]